MLLACLITFPWLFGGTREWTISVLMIALYGMAGFWAIGQITKYVAQDRGHGCQVPTPLFVLSLLISLWGWGVTFNAHSFFDPHLLSFVPLVDAAGRWPGTVDGESSRTNMLRISALLLTLLFSSYLAQRGVWRRRLLVSIAIGGISTALFGVAQKIAGGPLLFWEPERFNQINFAMYRYHANAAALLNLAWPACAALAIESFQAKGAVFARALWLPGTVVILAGVGVNLSKGGHLVTLIMFFLAGLLALAGRFMRRSHGRIRKVAPVPMVIAFAAVCAMVALIGYEDGLRRWQDLWANTSSQQARVAMARTCLDMVHASPWVGFGPGTFAVAVPFYTHPYAENLAGIWRFAHCDYLQTLVEWGIVGSLLWSCILFGGMHRAASCFLNKERFSRHVERRSGLTNTRPSSGLFDAAIFLSLSGVAVHAIFDFPLQISSIQLYAAALLGCAWASRRS